MKHTYKILAVFLLCWVYLNWAAEAQAYDLDHREKLVDVLNGYGKDFYQRGYWADAVHEFSTVLILDPNNQTARKYLKQMSMSDSWDMEPKTMPPRSIELAPKAEPAFPQPPPVPTGDGVRYQKYQRMNTIAEEMIQWYEQEIEKLKTELNASRAQFIQKDISLKNFADEINAEKARSFQQALDYARNLKALGEQLNKKDKENEILNEFLLITELKWVDGKGGRPPAPTIVLPSPELPAEAANGDLPQNLEEARRKLMENTVIMEKKNEELKRLQEQLTDAQQQLNLSHQLIQEKDNRIRSLESKPDKDQE